MLVRCILLGWNRCSDPVPMSISEMPSEAIASDALDSSLATRSFVVLACSLSWAMACSSSESVSLSGAVASSIFVSTAVSNVLLLSSTVSLMLLFISVCKLEVLASTFCKRSACASALMAAIVMLESCELGGDPAGRVA